MFKIISDMKKTISIDHEKCVSCGLCVDACTCRLLVMVDDFPEPRMDRIEKEKSEQIGDVSKYVTPTCANCRVCIIACPQEAIEIRTEMSGVNYEGALPEGELMYPR